MIVKDASNLNRDPRMPDVPRQFLCYMKYCFPVGVPQNKVYKDFTIDLGERLALWGYTDVVFDIEELGGSPETAVWNLQDPVTRPLGVELWTEFMTYIRQGYGRTAEECTFSMYGGMPSYDDYVGWGWTGDHNDIAAERQDGYMQWDRELRPMMRLMDRACPSVYGYFQDFTDGRTREGYGIEWTLDEYREMQIQCYQNSADSIARFHDLPTAFYVTTNKYGTPYPQNNLAWQLDALSDITDEVHVWNAKSYESEFKATDVGIMAAYAGRTM